MENEFKFTGYPVQGHDEDYLQVIDKEEIDAVSMTDLFVRSGPTEKCDSFMHTDLLNELVSKDERVMAVAGAGRRGSIEASIDDVQKFRERTGKKYPQLYRVKIAFEAIPLTEEENNSYWEEHLREFTKPR